MSYTKDLANYAANVKFEDLPAQVVEQARHITQHTVGVALAASTTDIGRRATAYGKDMGRGMPEATVLGDGARVSAACAALINGALVDCLDWEDCSWTGHPSACAVPTALAMSERLGASGRDYLLALVTAYEVYERIAMAVQPGANFGWLSKGWGLTSWSIYASAIAAGKLLGLDADRMENLIGIAGALTPTINSTTHISRSDFYHYQWGLNNYSGIAGALLAQSGISPMPDYLDGDTGYWTTMTDECKWEWYNKDLGSRYLIMETLFKHWPTNMWIQQALDGTADLVRGHGIRPDRVAEVIVSPDVENRMAVMPGGYPSMVDAQFSIPYCVSALIHDPVPGPGWYTEERRHNPSILALARKVRAEGPVLYLKAAFEEFQRGSYPVYTVTIRLTDGREVRRDVPLPKGHPRHRFSEREYADRFLHAAGMALAPEAARTALDALCELDRVPHMGSVMELLGAGR